MKIGLTLSRYLAKNYIVNMLLILMGLLTLIYLFDTIELIRRASKSDAVPLGLVLKMGLFKLPEVGQILFPFAILFGAIFTFWKMGRRSELVVLRSSGYSVWQFLLPLILLALAVGTLQITAINPLSSLLLGKYENLENQYLNKHDNQIALFKGGLWLRQSLNGNAIDENAAPDESADEDYVIIHARRVDQANWLFKNVTAFHFNGDDTFLTRVDAKTVTLEKGRWLFENTLTHTKNTETQQAEKLALPTNLTIQDIEESFSSPEAMSFWDLPSHIQTLEDTGFDATRLKVYYHNLLAQPLFLASMILLAATVALRPQRSGGTLALISGGIFIGFAVFFISSYLQALGYSNQIPPILAAWSPSLICTLIGLSVLMSLEDG